jgi:hypothetical protein
VLSALRRPEVLAQVLARGLRKAMGRAWSNWRDGGTGERDAVLALNRLRVYDDSHLDDAAVIATQGSRAAAQLGC